MLFPTVLVGVFFLTLNFNHKVLYAPSDYKNEDNFLKLFGKASTEEAEEKLRGELEEVVEAAKAEEAEEVKETKKDEVAEKVIEERDKTLGISTTEIKRMKWESHLNNLTSQLWQRDLIANVTLAEKLSINKLSKDLGFEFKTNIALKTNSNRKIVFDAFAMHNAVAHAVEVKLFKNIHVNPKRFERMLLESESMVTRYDGGITSEKFILHLVVVLDNSKVDINKVKETFNRYLEKYKVNVMLHVFRMEDLLNGYQYNPLP